MLCWECTMAAHRREQPLHHGILIEAKTFTEWTGQSISGCMLPLPTQQPIDEGTGKAYTAVCFTIRNVAARLLAPCNQQHQLATTSYNRVSPVQLTAPSTAAHCHVKMERFTMTHLSIDCSFSSSFFCRSMTPRMIFLSSSVRWLRSGCSGSTPAAGGAAGPPRCPSGADIFRHNC